jgi:hypothetical protein
MFERVPYHEIPQKIRISRTRKFTLKSGSNFLYKVGFSRQDGIRYVYHRLSPPKEHMYKLDGRTFRLLKKAIREKRDITLDEFMVYRRGHILTKI